jgi:hypothetical protein
LFNSDIVRSVFDKPFVSKWLFDIEIFLRIQGAVGKENYVKKVCEIPVNEWKEVGGSKLKTSDFILAPLEILKIYRKYKKIVVS